MVPLPVPLYFCRAAHLRVPSMPKDTALFYVLGICLGDYNCLLIGHPVCRPCVF